jgi:hypothetical protein
LSARFEPSALAFSQSSQALTTSVVQDFPPHRFFMCVRVGPQRDLADSEP